MKEPSFGGKFLLLHVRGKRAQNNPKMTFYLFFKKFYYAWNEWELKAHAWKFSYSQMLKMPVANRIARLAKYGSLWFCGCRCASTEKNRNSQFK